MQNEHKETPNYHDKLQQRSQRDDRKENCCKNDHREMQNNHKQTQHAQREPQNDHEETQNNQTHKTPRPHAARPRSRGAIADDTKMSWETRKQPPRNIKCPQKERQETENKPQTHKTMPNHNKDALALVIILISHNVCQNIKLMWYFSNSSKVERYIPEHPSNSKLPKHKSSSC